MQRILTGSSGICRWEVIEEMTIVLRSLEHSHDGHEIRVPDDCTLGSDEDMTRCFLNGLHFIEELASYWPVTGSYVVELVPAPGHQNC